MSINSIGKTAANMQGLQSQWQEHVNLQKEILHTLHRLVRDFESQPGQIAISDDEVNGDLDVQFPVPNANRVLLRRTAISSGPSITSTSSIILPSNSRRLGLSIVNSGAAAVYLGLGNVAISGQGIYLAANGGSWDGRISDLVWMGNVSAICATTSTLTVLEV